MDCSSSGTVNIAMLGSFGVWTRGTLQSRALPLARHLTATSNLRFAIITTPWDDPSQAGVNEAVDGVTIYNTRHFKPASTPLAVAEQLQILRNVNPELVHVMKPKAFAGLAGSALQRLRPGMPLVVDHDDWEGDGGWNDVSGYNVAARRLFDVQERRLLASAAGVTVASTLLEERVKRLRSDSSGQAVLFLPNGLDTGWIAKLRRPARDGQRIHAPALVLYSRFAEFSNDWLGRMLDALDSQLDNPIDLHLIGKNEPASSRHWKYRSIRPRWHGIVEREKIPDLLHQATIALYPYEDNLINRSKQSVKLLELMASGCAVVASNIGDVKPIGGDALVAVENRSPQVFANAVHQLIGNRDEAERLAATARARSVEYTTEFLAVSLLDFYRARGLQAG